jgi:hypothetical protein
LRLCEAWQSCAVDAAKLAVEVGCLDVQGLKRRDRARIFGAPVEPGPGQKLRAAVVDPRRHAISVQLYFMHPLWARGRVFDGLRELGRDKERKRELDRLRRDEPALTA